MTRRRWLILIGVVFGLIILGGLASAAPAPALPNAGGGPGQSTRLAAGPLQGTPTPTPTCRPGAPCSTATPTACGSGGCPTDTPTQCPVPPGCPTDTPTPCGAQGCPTDTPTPCGAQGCPTDTPTPCGAQGCPTDTPTPCGAQGCGTDTPTPCGAQGCGTASPTPTCQPGLPCNTATATACPNGICASATRTQPPTFTPTRPPTGTPTYTASSTRTRTATATPPCIVLGHYTATVIPATMIPAQQDLGNHCDDCVTGLNFPFPVQFYGVSYGKGVVSSNGNVQFVPESSSHDATCLPNPALDTAIMLYQGDLATDGPGEGIYSATLGTEPNRIFVLEWRAHYVTRQGTSNEELVFTENSSSIDMVYGANADDGADEVSGLQEGTTNASQWSCHTPDLPAGRQIHWGWIPPLIICSPTPTLSPTRTATATPTACVTTTLSNGFETGTLEGYTSVVPLCPSGGCGWVNTGTAAHTGTRSLFAPDVALPSDQQLTSPAFTVPGAATLSFWHRYSLEHPLWDGGELEIKVGSGPWATVTPATISPPYPPGVIPGSFSNPLVGKQGWTNQNPSWPAFDPVSVSLGAYAGQSIQFRFRLGTDYGNAGLGPALGWWIDDIRVTGLCATPTPHPTCIAPPPGLTYWYPLDETSGVISQDIIGGNNGTHNNGPVPNVSQYVANSLHFNGSNQWVSVPASNAPAFGTADFSIDMWMQVPPSALGGTEVFLDTRSWAPQGVELFLYAGRLGVQLADQLSPPPGYSNYIAPASSPFPADNQWHLVAVTVRRAAGGGTLWLDGVPIYTFTPRLGNLTSTAALWLGRHHPNASVPSDLWFTGSLDEVEIFNRALGTADITAIYQAHQNGKCKTDTPAPTPTPPPCRWCYIDVPAGSAFYPYVTCLSYGGVISGYGDNTYRPFNSITRGQIAKVVALSAGFGDNPAGQTFADVPPSQPFYRWIEQMAARSIIGGYTCGGPGEPCDATHRPYFRPYANATRAQLSKIVVLAAMYPDVPSGQAFTDVPTTQPFYAWITVLAARGAISGYTCGGPGEPCDSAHRPYFRPYANVTRGQGAKIVANTFSPDCEVVPLP